MSYEGNMVQLNNMSTLKDSWNLCVVKIRYVPSDEDRFRALDFVISLLFEP